jgi:hypothetical protein
MAKFENMKRVKVDEFKEDLFKLPKDYRSGQVIKV